MHFMLFETVLRLIESSCFYSSIRSGFVTELKNSLILRTRFIPRLAGAWVDGAVGWLAWEYMNEGTLDKLVKRNGKCPIPVVSAIARQVILALNAVHYLGRVHNDVSTRSVWINSNGDCKLF